MADPEKSQRRSAQGLHRLSALAVNAIAAPGWHADGGGLYLEVDPGGRKRWAMRITINGRRRDFGLGPIHKVPLQQARERAAEYRRKAYAGIDPDGGSRDQLARLNVTGAGPTVERAIDEVHRVRKAEWSNGKHVDQWINTLTDHVVPLIGKKLVGAVTTADILTVLLPIWTSKPETARRVRQRMRTVLDWARAAGYRSGDNPVDLIGDALPRQRRKIAHHEALPYAEVADFLRDLRASVVEDVTKDAFEFLILTAARTKEVRLALWAEVKLEAGLWIVPPHRMKAGREHTVPLSARAIEILEKYRPDKSSPQSLIFSDRKSRSELSENRFLNARDAIGYSERCTPHGFRSSFRDWAAEDTLFPAEVVEMALAHTIASKTEAAYRRGDLLAKRRKLMAAWQDFIVMPRHA